MLLSKARTLGNIVVLSILIFCRALQRVTTKLKCEKKCSNDLKRAQKKPINPKGELKKKDKEYKAECTALAKERIVAAEVKTLASKVLYIAHDEVDKTRGELFKFHKVAQGPIY